MSAPTITAPSAAGGGVPVGGSGAAGYVAKWTAATTLGGSATTGATASLYVDATGNVGIGTTAPSSLGTNYTTLDIRGSAGGGIRAGTPSIMSYMYADASGWNVATSTALPIIFYTNNTERARIDSSGNLILNTVNTGATIQAAGTSQGLKLPATPGNTDPNTLDSYREGTRVLAAGDLSGWTYVTTTQYWTLVGRTVTLHTIFTGGASSATGGATIATPPLLTPLRIAAGAAVNSSGTALGNGVCLVASTSSTTGTVTTSSAISSSSVDKVITVTYETAGL